MRGLERASPSRLRVRLFLIVALVLVGLITHGNYAGSGDAVHYMVIARSVALGHDFDLGDDYGDPDNIIKERPGNHAQIGANGVLRPVHDVGLPVLAAPWFGVAYRLAALTDQLPPALRRRAKINDFIALRQLVSLFMILVTATLAVTFFTVSWRLTGRKALAFVWSVVWALSPPILSVGYVFLTEIPSALAALYVYSRLDDVLGKNPARRGVVLGLLTGLLLLIHVRNIGLVLALAALVVWRVRREPLRGSGFGAGLLVMGAIKIALNLQFWGTALTTPHEHFGPWLGAGAFVSETAIRFLGLFFDARHGLLPSAPIFLLAPAAWVVLTSRNRRAGYELLLLVVAYLIFVVNPVTNIHGWRGGWSPAARFLVPIAPLLALAVPSLLTARLGRHVVAAFVVVQLALDAFFWGRPMLQWSEGPGPAPWLQALVGRSIASMVPVWERLDTTVVLASLAGFVMWTVMTRAIVRATIQPVES